MDTFGVVVIDLAGNTFMQVRQVCKAAERSELVFKTAEPALHEAVLPGTAFGAARQCNPQPPAQFLVLGTEVFAALVRVQDSWRWVLAEGVRQGSERQFAAVPQPQRPAQYLPGLQVEYDGQIVPAAIEPDIGEVLHPGVGTCHAGVTLAVLRPGFVLETSIRLERVVRCRHFTWRNLAGTVLFAGPGDMDVSQITDAPGLGFAPIQLNG